MWGGVGGGGYDRGTYWSVQNYLQNCCLWSKITSSNPTEQTNFEKRLIGSAALVRILAPHFVMYDRFTIYFNM